MDDYGLPSRSKVSARKPWWNPRYWSRRVWIGVVILILVIIVVAVVAGVLAGKKSSSSAYPDYSPLAYSLADTYSTDSFFDNFNYFYNYDPAGGFVHYDNAGDAKAKNLTGSLADGSVFLKVDTVETDASTGRHSVRLHSKKTYNKGLFIFDVKHTPYGCGTWPALWLTDPSNWPAHGEIDIMEATNQGTSGNAMTLHTSSDCSMDVRRNMTGSAEQTNCDKDANSNAGCGVSGKSSSFGPDWNKGGGGVLAVEWRDAGIRMWQFTRDAVPADITGKAPTPQTWGVPAADFPNTGCNIGSHFQNNSIVANIDLCGDLQNGNNGAYAKSGCPSDCKTLVTSQPQAFVNAYWNFGDFLVYQAS